MKLLHDPGHGGSNRGCEHAGLIEREWVLGLSTDLVVALSGFGVQQKLTREMDISLPYEDRAAAGWQWGAKLVFCHHVNAAVKKDSAGVEVPDESPDGLIAFALAEDSIAQAVGDAIMRAAPIGLLRSKAKTVPATPFDWTENANNVMRHYARHSMHVVLIEWGFATSPRDRAVLQSATSRPALCAAVAAGVGRAYELLSAA